MPSVGNEGRITNVSLSSAEAKLVCPLPSDRNDGAARGEAEFTQTIPSRDRGRRSQTKIALPSGGLDHP